MVRLFLACASLLTVFSTSAQMITGVWKGKINRQKVEVKIIQSGDSLTGTSYYYESAGNYRRYSIKGYFDPNNNNAVWWDDQLIEEKSGRFSISTPGKMPMLSRADFNCPGNNRMMLDGKVSKKDESEPSGEVHLDKIRNPEFEDDWDFVIDNYTVGANDPYIIDSIDNLQHVGLQIEKPVVVKTSPPPVVKDPPVAKNTEPARPPRQTIEPPAKQPPAKQPVAVIVEPVKAPTIEEKFVSRKKVLVKEIPLEGDSLSSVFMIMRK